MGKKKLKRKIANLEDDMSSLLIENEKLRNIISGMQSYVNLTGELKLKSLISMELLNLKIISARA